MIAKFSRLEFEPFTKPSKSDFLRDHQIWIIVINWNYFEKETIG
jgi:hypothetical protein